MDVQVVMLRALAGLGARVQETTLKAGDVVPARVLKGGALLLAGVRVPATLPPGLEAGALVRLKVHEVTAQRVVLQVVDQPRSAQAQDAPAAPQLVPTTVPVPLPGGAVARLLVDPDEGGEEGGARGGPARSSVTLRYESAGLGRVDLSLAIEDGAVRAVAHAPAGEVASRLRSASGDLRAALAGALGRPASVDIVAHMEVLDVSA